MSYKITKGDLEITENVLSELAQQTFKRVRTFDFSDNNYAQYQALADVMIIVRKRKLIA